MYLNSIECHFSSPQWHHWGGSPCCRSDEPLTPTNDPGESAEELELKDEKHWWYELESLLERTPENMAGQIGAVSAGRYYKPAICSIAQSILY